MKCDMQLAFILFLILPSSIFAQQVSSGAVASLDGRVVVSERDISSWSSAQSCYGPDALTSRKAAFLKLLEVAIAESALRSAAGVVISSKDIEVEAKRFDSETRAPEILTCVKQNLGQDEAYRRVFVHSILIESRLRQFLNGKKNEHGVWMDQKIWFQSVPLMELEVYDQTLRTWVQNIHGNPRLSVVKLKL